ncbi:hypothetical protein SRHO_G00042950 [Serrasalmus rhombeus]
MVVFSNPANPAERTTEDKSTVLRSHSQSSSSAVQSIEVAHVSCPIWRRFIDSTACQICFQALKILKVSTRRMCPENVGVILSCRYLSS